MKGVLCWFRREIKEMNRIDSLQHCLPRGQEEVEFEDVKGSKCEMRTETRRIR